MAEAETPLRASEEIELKEQLDRRFKPIFEEYEESGGIPLRVLRHKFKESGLSEEIPPDKLELVLQKADGDADGHLTYEEFVRLVTSKNGRILTKAELTKFQRVLRGAVSSVVPRGSRTSAGDDYVDNYLEHYNCKPPPLFMILISIIEIGVFIFYAVELSSGDKPGGPITATTGLALYSPFIYNPSRRYEAWRFLSYMLLHQGYIHLISNLIFQLFLGLPLEMVHKWWRVGIVYFLGVIAGSLCHSIFDTRTLLAGASGGCYALVGAHFAIIVMNWKEMTHDWMDGPVKFLSSAPVRLLIWTLFAALDTGVAIYNRYFADEQNNVGYAAHFGGALCGVLLGIPVLKNLDVKPWEKILWWIALVAYVLCMFAAIAWNLLFPNFPDTDRRPCCPVPEY